MSNLIEKYGTHWFQSKFNRSHFIRNGVLASVYDVTDDWVALKLQPKDRDPCIIRAKFDEFPDARMFNIPELGYRTHDKGKWLSYLGRNNSSYHRGLRHRDLTVVKSNITNHISHEVTIKNPNEMELMYKVFNPNYIPLHKGIKLMLEGKLMSVAVSASIAVVPDHESDGLLVLMNENVIGRVNENGELSYMFSYAAPYVEGKELQS